MSSIILVYSCAKSTDTNESLNIETSEVSFSGSISPITRVTSDVFESGDQIYVSAYENGSIYSSQMSYTYDGSLFSSSDPIYFNTNTQQLAFTAIYPAISGFDSSFTFSAGTDQSDSDNYELSDLLISTHEATSETCPTLSFSHVMSSLIVNISDSDLSGGTLKIFAQTSATIDIVSQSYTSTGSTSEIIAANNGDMSYKVIIAPQTISAGETIATYTIGDNTYTWSANNNIELVSGYRYTYTWNIANDEISYDGSIEGWNDSDFTDSEVIEYTETSSSLYLSEISAYSYPASETWEILDVTATTADFEGLRNAINKISTDDNSRQISIDFINLEIIPENAMHNEINTTVLKTVSGNNVTTIESTAFRDCSNLNSVYFPSAEYLGFGAFYCCGLTEIDFPSVTTIKSEAFDYCNISSVNLPNATTIECRMGFQMSYISLPKLEVINEYLFNSGDYEVIDIPVAKIIGDIAFGGCNSLKSIDLSNVTSIGNGIFAGSSAISSVTLNENYYTLESGFIYNSSKTEIVGSLCGVVGGYLNAEESVTSIKDYALYGCYSLVTVDLPNVETIGSIGFQDCKYLQIVDMPSVVTIKDAAFAHCSNLTTINIPNVITIDDKAFYCCTCLDDVSAPSLTSIGMQSFIDCKSLTSVDMPLVTRIESEAFANCTSLTSLKFATTTGVSLNSVDPNTFYETTTENIHLTLGAENWPFVDGNVLSITGGTWTFKSITLLSE